MKIYTGQMDEVMISPLALAVCTKDFMLFELILDYFENIDPDLGVVTTSISKDENGLQNKVIKRTSPL